MILIGFIIPTFFVLVLVGTVWAAGVAWGLGNRWPVALFIGAGLAGALGGPTTRISDCTRRCVLGRQFHLGFGDCLEGE